MELTYKDYKKIKNTGQLPGFEQGQVPVNNIAAITSIPEIVVTGHRRSNPDIASSQPTNYTNSPQVPIINISKNQPIGDGSNAEYSQADSAATAAGPWFAIGSWLGGGVMEGLGMAKSSDQLMAEAGTSQGNVGGIGYTRQNVVNAGQIMADYDRKSQMKWLTNPATALTSWLNRGNARREAQLAQQKSYNLGQEQWGSAYTKSLRLNNAKEYGNSTQQVLFAKNGKLPSCEDGKPVYTAYGPMNIEPNAKVSKGEVIYKTDMFGNVMAADRVPGKPDNKDTEYAFLGNNYEAGVATNKNHASDYAAIGRFDIAEQITRDNNLYQAKNGKMPKFAEGYWGNFIPHAIGAAASLDQILNASLEKPYKPNTYVSNPYELNALSTLAGLRVNPYPIMQQIRGAESRTNRAIDRSGGLSIGQRNLSRLSALNGTQQNIGNVLSSIQQQNNTYLGNYAQMALNAGNANRQARQQANQFDLDYYSKAHAARQQGQQMGIRNLIDQVQSYYANDFKRRQFNDTMGLYRQQLSLDQQRLIHDMELDKKRNDEIAKKQINPLVYNPIVNPGLNLKNPLTYRNITGRSLSTPWLYERYPKIRRR